MTTIRYVLYWNWRRCFTSKALFLVVCFVLVWYLWWFVQCRVVFNWKGYIYDVRAFCLTTHIYIKIFSSFWLLIFIKSCFFFCDYFNTIYLLLYLVLYLSILYFSIQENSFFPPFIIWATLSSPTALKIILCFFGKHVPFFIWIYYRIELSFFYKWNNRDVICCVENYYICFCKFLEKGFDDLLLAIYRR